MNNLDDIENYFSSSMTPDEIRAFEQKIQADPSFAESVAFYLSALKTTKEHLEEEKKVRFKELYKNYVTENPESTPETYQPSLVRKMVYLFATAAAVAGIIFGINRFTGSSSPQKLADRFIQENIQTLGVTMSSHRDSIQTGLQYYNEGNFQAALDQFEMILHSDSSMFDAKKYAGYAALRLKKYDKALAYFQQMENAKGLYSNRALILQATTLMERNQGNDIARAKQILQIIINQNEEDKETARQWLDII